MYTITATATVHGQTHQLSILFNLRNYLEISGFLYKKEKINKRCLPIRKHRGAREKRYSFGYAVFLILALMK